MRGVGSLLLVGLLGATQLQATPASAAPAPVSLIVPTTSSVWASSAYPGAAPENAYDCDPGSPWNAGGYGGSLLAQFTQPITFNGIQLVVSALPSTAESYTFNGSNDGINWTPITSTTVGVPQGDPTLPLVTFPGVTYQYLSIDVNGGASWVAILDVRLQVSAGDNVPAVATCGTVLPSTTAQIRLTSTTPDGGTIAAGPAPSMTGTASFTAAISNTNLPALDGIPVSFSVSGANPQTLTAVTDATGTATVSYSGGTAGTDSVVAAATIDGVTIATDPRSVVWGAPPPTINDLVAGEYVDGLLTLSGSTVPGGHVRCTHSNGGDIWETDADASGVWSLQINLSGDADGEDILYVEDGSGGGYFHQYTGGAGGFPVFVDASGSGPDFHIIGGDGSNGADVYLGDASVGIQPLADGLGAPSSIRNIVWSATGDDVINWTTVAGGPCGCLPNGSIIFHRIGSRTLSYYVVDEFGHRGAIRHRIIRNQAPLTVSQVTASPGAFSTLVTATSGGADQTTIRYRLSGPGLVTVTILDGSGTLLRTLVSGASRPAGTYSSGDVWDGTTDSGELVSSCTCRVRVDAVDLLGNPGVGGSALVTIGSAPVTLPDLAPALGAPSPAATPELDSLALFGSGLAGIGGYVLLRLRAGRRRS